MAENDKRGWADATKTSKPRLADERQCSLAEVTRERDDLKAKLAEAERQWKELATAIIRPDDDERIEWSDWPQAEVLDAAKEQEEAFRTLSTYPQIERERDDLTAAHSRLWNALDSAVAKLAEMQRGPDVIDADRIKASDALNAVTQERDDLTAAHRRLWNALDRIASLNRTELPDHIDPFARAVCMAQDAIGPQDDVEDDKE